MKCVLVEIDGRPGYQECRRCGKARGWPTGQRRPSPAPVNYSRECLLPGEQSAATTQLSLRQRYQDWRDATEEWSAAGKPERTAAEQHALADVCRGCDQYNPDPLLPIVMGGGQCQACGCGLQPERSLFNALRYATYKCKLGRWNELIETGGASYVRPPKIEHRDTADERGSAAG